MAGSKKIGLIGEDPSDTAAIRNLLLKKYDYDFIPLLKNQTGDNLETAKTKRMLSVELERRKLDLLIFIRDLDALESDEVQISKRYDWFNRFKSYFNGPSVFLLNIYELEALILSDIASFNNAYKTAINFRGNPMMQKEPKEFLISRTDKLRRKYRESDAPELFRQLDIDIILKKCRYFREFIQVLDTALT